MFDTIINYVFMFFIFSAVGWAIECTYRSLGERRIINSGFLYGPMCPIYGTGCLVFDICLVPISEPIEKKIIIVLLLGMVLADAVEYGEWKLGKRNESVSFAVQPFINKLGGAIGTGVVTVTLIVSGINPVSQQITQLEQIIETATDPAVAANAQTQIDALINGVTGSPLWIMKTAMMILPLICIVVGFWVYSKKFKIDEKMYAQIVTDLKNKEESI